MLFTLIVAIGWLYVALMMAVAEAASSNGSLLGAIFTFLLYGLGPVALVIYIMATPLRKKIRRAREAEAERAAAASAAASAQPDSGGEAPACAVAPVRKEP
jgi:mannose/fructose/N-acetylgalactosamine-specific phosphotransferase system component IID